MKKIFTLLAAILMTAAISAQAPDKMSYQAIIRNTEGNLVTEQEVGMQISILQGSAEGTVVYTETKTPSTNKNGLVSIEIGGEAGFAAIDWSDGPYFIKTETDPEGGTNYTISGTSQLLTVPYALHAKTAETISEPIVESDPVFEASPAAGIEAADIINWDEAHSWGDHAEEGYLTEETDPLFTAWDRSAGIEITESQIADLQTYYLASNPDGFITAYIVTEEDVTAHESALSISESQISDLQSYLTSITGQSIGDLSDVDLTGIEAGKVLKYDAGEEMWVIADDMGIKEEEDPIFTSSEASNITDAGSGKVITDAERDKLAGIDGSETKIEAGTNITITGSGTTASPYDISLSVPTYTIGINEDLGGYVFYVTPNGKHGLVAAMQNQRSNWYNAQDNISNPANHDANGKKFTDWRLPTKYELNLMYLQRENIGGFFSDRYWSSTEDVDNRAWVRNFGDGNQHLYSKLDTGRIRAVRAF